MLAKAVAAAAAPINFKFSRNGSRYLIRIPFGHVNLQNRISDGCSNKKWRRRTRLAVNAGYTRRPMGTSGAYQLIDDETGDKFIIWGGIDDKDEDSPIPSEDVLYWKPSNDDSSGSNIAGSNSSEDECINNNHHRATTGRGGNRAHKKGLAGSFGKLKAQRVRDLVRTTSWTKQDINNRDYDEKIVKDAPFHGSVSSHFEPELLVEQKRLDVHKGRTNVSRATQSKETQDVMKNVLTKEDMELSEIAIEHGVEQLSKYQTTPAKFQKSDGGVSVSKLSATSLQGWNHGETIHNYRSKPKGIPKKWQKSNTDSDFFSRMSFRDMGCSDYMIESLRSLLFIRPSHIQAMAFSPVIEGKSCIIADQSGSGKTLAYLLPVIQRIRQEELQGLGKSVSQNPRVIILVPTAELASQVLSNCRSMSKFGVPFRSMVATGGFRQRTQLENLRQGLDVLIATPGRFMFLVKEGFLQLTDLRCAVLDEVDILLNDEDFEPALQSLINSSPVTMQYLFVTATLPVNIYNNLVEVFPDCEVIMGPGMHRTSPGLEEILIDCSGDDGTEKTPDTAFLNKKSALLQLVEGSTASKTIVFCNKIETCRKVENALKRFDRKGIHMGVLPFHAALAQESRLANMEEFCSSQLRDSSLFLVCTDRASRGIDFEGVDHVVLFDFPRDPSEYVRRVGRTARGAGGKGKAFIFVVGKQVSLARRIIDRNRKGHPLHDVPAICERLS